MGKWIFKSYFFKSILQIRNRRGSTIITALMVASVIAIGISFLADRILSQQKLSRNLSTDISYSIAIQSVTDYARYALKHKWCFPSDGNSIDPDTVANCSANYTHPRSLIRLLLPLKYARTLFQFKNNPASSNFISGTFPSTADAMVLDEFTIESSLDNLAANHPIRIILNNIKGTVPVGKIRIKYENVSDINLPSVSDQKYIRITTSLLDASNRIIQNGAQKASETQLLYVSPREVNYFSLILGGNLFLGKTGNPTSNNGDGYIPAASSSARGVSFYGPVFVNKNIVLPSSTYSPVGFYEPVVLGSGYIGQGTTTIAPFEYNGALGNQRVWSDTGLFRGFFAGIDIDGTSDVGLDSIAGTIASAQTNNEAVSQCINVLREKNEVGATAGSFLFAQFNSAATTTYRNYRLAFLKNKDSGIQKKFHPQKLDPATATQKLISCASAPTDFTQHFTKLINYCHQSPTNGGNDRLLAFNAELALTVDPIISAFPAVMSDIPLLDATDSSPAVTLVRLKSSDTATNFATIEIKVSQVKINNVVQPHFRDVEINLKDLPNIAPRYVPYIKLTAFDNTCDKGLCATPGSGPSKEIYLTKFTSNAQGLCTANQIYKSSAIPEDSTNWCPSGTTLSVPAQPSPYIFPPGTEDYGSIVNRCDTSSSINMSGVSSNNLEKSFAENSADGWYYNNGTDRPVPPAPYPNKEFNSYDATASSSSGIYEICKVPSTVNRVIGNWVCRKLNIESRSNPLQFIGTMIVTNNLYIHPSAVTAGVYFYSVHHPAAVQILRDAQVLKTSSGASCTSLPTPHWHPDPGLQTLSDRVSCSPLSTFNAADPIKYPMRWTSISADCGYLKKIPGADQNMPETEPTCIKKINNYFFQSLERQYVK